jgi:2-polyprenyl-3-methyl-5-hydroxy-6-metoxy-1,4-benzoquinol methylase
MHSKPSSDVIDKVNTGVRLQQNTYDQFADEYTAYLRQMDEGAFSFQRDLIIPKLLRQVGEVAGLNVLDAGCGEGIVARLLAERGANVTAIDIAPRLIELAQAQDTQGTITYQTHDLSQPLPQYTHAFDIVVSNLVLNDVPDYRGFIATLGAVTKAGGRAVLSLNNPYSAVIREKVEGYFDSGTVQLYNMAKEGVAVYYFHRTLEEYITAFREAGFLLQGLLDVQVREEMVSKMPALNKQLPYSHMYPRFPFFMILDFVKPTAVAGEV